MPPVDEDMHHADPEIAYAGSTLYLFYATISRRGRRSVINVAATRDGIRWTPPVVIYEDSLAVSPTVVTADGRWFLWLVCCDGTKSLIDASSLLSLRGESAFSLRNTQKCALQIPGCRAWHIDVLRVGERYEALIAAFKRGKDPSRSALFHAVSRDGITFKLSDDKPVLAPSIFGWDNKMIYRSTFLKTEKGYRIWYSGASWLPRFGLSYCETTKIGRASLRIGFKAPRFLLEDLYGLVKYFALKKLSGTSIEKLRKLRFFLLGLKSIVL
jgi:hypothetical protein